jgi:hypothetical protein
MSTAQGVFERVQIVYQRTYRKGEPSLDFFTPDYTNWWQRIHHNYLVVTKPASQQLLCSLLSTWDGLATVSPVFFIAPVRRVLSAFEPGEEVGEEKLAQSLSDISSLRRKEDKGVVRSTLAKGGPHAAFILLEPGHPSSWSDPRCSSLLRWLNSRSIPCFLLSTWLPDLSEFPPHVRSEFRGWNSKTAIQYWGDDFGNGHLNLFLSDFGRSISVDTINFLRQHLKNDSELVKTSEPVIFMRKLCDRCIQIYSEKNSTGFSFSERFPRHSVLLRVARDLAFSLSVLGKKYFRISEIETLISEEDKNYFTSVSDFLKHCPLFAWEYSELHGDGKLFHFSVPFQNYLASRYVCETFIEAPEHKKFLSEMEGTNFERTTFAWRHSILLHENEENFYKLVEPSLDEPRASGWVDQWISFLAINDFPVDQAIVTKISEIVETNLRTTIMSDDDDNEGLNWCHIFNIIPRVEKEYFLFFDFFKMKKNKSVSNT